MGFLSDAWSSVKDTVSDAWSGVKDTVEDVTGVESMNSFLLAPGLSSGIAALSGKGVLGEAVQGVINPLLQPYGQGQAPSMMSGSLNQSAPANLTMGAGAPAQAQVVGSPNSLASYFGQEGYSMGPTETSAALLAANPDAYQFSPLASGLA